MDENLLDLGPSAVREFDLLPFPPPSEVDEREVVDLRGPFLKLVL